MKSIFLFELAIKKEIRDLPTISNKKLTGVFIH